MTLLLTGPTGFLGRHVLQALEADGSFDDIVVLVRKRADWDACTWAQKLPRVKVLEGTVTDAEKWQDDPLLHNLRGVFHLAALVRHNRRDTEEVYRVNIEGTTNMVRVAARYGARMVFVSTSGTVGCSREAHGDAPVDEDAPYCETEVRGWPYYTSKIRAERAARAAADALGVRLVVVRPPMLLGPGDHRFRSTGTVIRFLRGRLPFLIRGGIHYVDIRDAAVALVAAMKHPEPRPVYHLQGTACSIDRFFYDLSRISGRRAPKFHLPMPVALSLAKADEWIGVRLHGHPLALFPDPVVIEMAGRYWGLNSRYAETDLGFNPRDGRVTLKDTVSWLREHRDDC